MLKKMLIFLLYTTLVLGVTACIAAYLVLRFTLAPARGEWATRLQLGPVGVDIGVPAALRLASSPWIAPLIKGHAIETRFGPVRLDWNKAEGVLELHCAPCSAAAPSLGSAPPRVDRLKATVRRDIGAAFSGEFEARTIEAAATGDGGEAVLRGAWSGRLTQKNLALDIRADAAPIAHWYAVIAPGLPELKHARIGGAMALRAEVSLPDGAYALHPRIAGFSVDGLGTEAIANARGSCGPASGLGKDSWLARAVVAAEDQRFFTHPGYDLDELAASLETNQKAAQVERGGSTLTQQLAKILVTGGEQNAGRKLRELLYAVEMERTLGKARILALYLDNAPWGAQICGAERAARTYFDRPAGKLEPAQAVWLAAMLPNPAAAVRQWKQEGHIDIARATRVADSVRGIGRGQREALMKGVAAAQFVAP